MEPVVAPTPQMADVLAAVVAERGAQDRKWGVQRHDNFLWNTILSEEVGESAMAALAAAFSDTEPGSLERAALTEDLRSELVQVAAVAVAWVECIDAIEGRYTR